MTNDSEVTIRTVRIEDAAGIGAILRDVGWFDHINEEAPPDTEVRAAQAIEAVLTGCSDFTAMYIAEKEGEVVGYVKAHWLPNMAAGMEGYVSELFVRESHRGAGIGKRLLAEVEREGLTHGCNRIMLYIRRSREAYTRKFYPRSQWTERTDAAMFVYYPTVETE